MRLLNVLDTVLRQFTYQYFFLFILFLYSVLPFVLYSVFDFNRYYLLLSQITLSGLCVASISYRINLIDDWVSSIAKVRINPLKFHVFIWSIFISIFLYLCLTATEIPIVSALLGADAESVSAARGAFMKGRDGLAKLLIYPISFFYTVLLPYSIILLYQNKSRLRYFAISIFTIFCLATTAKAMFVFIALPLIYFSIFNYPLGNSGRVLIYIALLVGSLVFLTVLTISSGESSGIVSLGIDDYFSSSAAKNTGGTFSFIIWRSIAVNIFTAADTLQVFFEQLKGDLLLGSTSSSLSFIFGMDQVMIERMVFEHQFGSWNDIANANAFFLIDGFINFGILGVFLYGLLSGQILRLLSRSSIGFSALGPIFCFGLVTSGLIGNLLGNGWLLLLILRIFFVVGRE